VANESFHKYGGAGKNVWRCKEYEK